MSVEQSWAEKVRDVRLEFQNNPFYAIVIAERTKDLLLSLEENKVLAQVEDLNISLLENGTEVTVLLSNIQEGIVKIDVKASRYIVSHKGETYLYSQIHFWEPQASRLYPPAVVDLNNTLSELYQPTPINGPK